jgi:glyoxylase-like metal-dependent hydrolase (beta-lactamase superfamily II)
MHANAALRPVLWDVGYRGSIPPTPVTAVTVTDNRLTLEGHDLVIVEVGHTDSGDTTVLHVPDLELVVAGDVLYNGVHMYLGQSVAVGGFGPWRNAIDMVEALQPRRIVCGHQNEQLDDDAERTIAETRRYLDDADELLRTHTTAVDFFNAEIERYPDHLGRTSCGRAPGRSTASASTPRRTSPGSSSPRGCEPRRHGTIQLRAAVDWR